jgi:hypothetical protein
MDRRFGTWNVRRPYRTSSLKIITRKLSKYKVMKFIKLGLMGDKNVSWDKGDTEPTSDYTLFYGNGYANNHLRTLFVHKRIISVVVCCQLRSSGSWRRNLVNNYQRPEGSTASIFRVGVGQDGDVRHLYRRRMVSGNAERRKKGKGKGRWLRDLEEGNSWGRPW